MALFKPFRGTRASLPQELHDGYAYFCTDDGSFHIDYVDSDGNLQRKQINAKDAETLMGVSLVELQSDWSINDETNPAYVKNRTHWVEVVPTTFINNEELPFSPYADAMYMYSGSLSHDFAIDNIYNVIWDNTEYVCTSFNYMGYPAIGNTNIIGVSNDGVAEPFFAYVASGTIVMVTNSTDASHIVSLSGDVVTYHTIDKNYLPHLVGTSGTGANSEVFNEYTGYNVAEGEYAHAEGYNTKALGSRSHAEGWLTEASGHNSHAEGCDTVASGAGAHAEGNSTEATGRQSHAEGDRAVASAWAAHAEGIRTTAASNYQHVQGMLNITDTAGKYLHIVGNGTFDATSESPSNAHTLDWDGNAWFQGTVKIGGTSQDDADAKEIATQETVDTKMDKENPVGTGSFSMQRKSGTEIGLYSVAIGYNNTASGKYSEAHGFNTTSTNEGSHAEGHGTTASGYASHSEGLSTNATGGYSHSEGYHTTAEGTSSHAEGNNTQATGLNAHAEGDSTIASGASAHTEGYATETRGNYAHAEGMGTIAGSVIQHAQGKYNVVDSAKKYAHIVGNGDDDTSRSNAHTLDWDGTAWFAGDVKVGGAGQDDAEAKVLATTDYVDTKTQLENLGIYIGPDEPTDANIKIWINTAEEGTGVTPLLPRIATITLVADAWEGSANPWSQVVTVNGVSVNSKVDLQPTAQQIVALSDAEISLMISNESGTVTAWAIGNKPTVDYTMQVLITEVAYV